MKRFIFLIFISFSSAELPSEFYITERFLSFASTFDISTDTETFATARGQFFSLTPSFDLEDANQKLIACSQARLFAWGTTIDVADPEGNLIGVIEEEIFRIFPWAEYKIFNKDHELIAIAKMDFWGTEFQLVHPDQPEEIYASVFRPFIRIIRDPWTVQIQNREIFEEALIDPRLLIMLAVYQTDKDNRDRYRIEFFDRLSQELNYW